MATNEEKAVRFLEKAEKTLSPTKGFFASLFGTSPKVEVAIEYYQKAANLFKMEKNWKAAGDAFYKAATLQAGCPHDTATNYVYAANCYRKYNADEAQNCFLLAIKIYTDMGRFTIAAKYHQTIAEIYENDSSASEKVLQHYETAANYYSGEENNSSANKCLLKVAQYAAVLENYEKAIKVYEQVAKSCFVNPLLLYSAKEYLFRATLCHLCVDILNAQLALDRYIQMLPSFQDYQEYKFICALIKHLEEQNVDGFSEAVNEYDDVLHLDQWYNMILLRIKKQFNNNPDLR